MKACKSYEYLNASRSHPPGYGTKRGLLWHHGRRNEGKIIPTSATDVLRSYELLKGGVNGEGIARIAPDLLKLTSAMTVFTAT